MLERKIRQFLVHSFLYYHLDESIIEDCKYDELTVELKNLVIKHKDYIYKDVIADTLGDEGSAFSIKKYPAEIISTALHLLYNSKYRHTKTFQNFLQTYGYKICN